jgi:hypothetical protein
VDRDPMTLEEALGGLRMSRSGRAWYVLEGPSQPDVYLATGEVIVIIEAKRTETGPTTSTKWMRVRHQMLRHLDAAWDIRGERRVYGLFVVEAEGETDVAPEAWRQAVDETVSPAILERSLPHRSEEVRSAIAGAVLGLVTWQTLCSRLGVPHEVLIPEVMDLRGAPRPARRRSGGVPRPPATPVDSA